MEIRNFASKMKAFNLEKVLKTNNAGVQGRLGCLQLTVTPSSNSSGESGTNEAEVESSTTSSSLPLPSEQRNYRTPMYIIHTQTGTIPHITPEVFKLIYPTTPESSKDSSPNPPVQISIDSTFKFFEPIKNFQKGIGKYIGLPDLPTFLTVHDPLQAIRAGHNDKFGIALWSRHGRNGLTPEHFSELVKAFKCNFSQILSDYDVNPEVSGMKRLRKSLSRAEVYTSHAVKENSAEGKDLSKSGLFITVEAPWFKMNEELAKKTVANMLESQQEIEGVVIAGITNNRFFKNEPEATTKGSKSSGRGEQCERLQVCQNIKEELDLVEKIVQSLPSNLPKFVPGPFQPIQILDLVAKGVDIFDTSLASRMADDARAFLLDEIELNLASLSTSVEKLPNCSNESLPERSSSTGEMDTDRRMSIESNEKVIVSLKSKRFFDDFGPISKTCTCYTCRKHTRSYIHHLYATDELLGPVLIQIHNLTALDRFFKLIRGIIDDSDTAEALQERFDLLRKLLGSEDGFLPLANERSDNEFKKYNRIG